MRILVLSDLHLEFDILNPSAAVRAAWDSADVVVLAGDIHIGLRGTFWAAETFKGKPIIYVPGNHEYYGGGVIQDMAVKADAFCPPNVIWGDLKVQVIDGVRFVMATLWTDFALFGTDRVNQCMNLAARMPDFNEIQIRYRQSLRLFRPEDALRLHKKTVAFLRKTLAKPFKGSTVVVTHHGPHRGSLAERFADQLISAAFISDLDNLMGKSALWLHGHTHHPFDFTVRGTRIVCNPRGYIIKGKPPEVEGFDPGKIVVI